MDIQDHAARFTAWLNEEALPLWRRRGYADGTGFVERIDQRGEPTADDVRARVNPRQVYCFAEAGRRGWPGDWRGAATGGLQRFEEVYRRDDGFYAHLATIDGRIVDDGFDLYDQAFALLAFAAMAQAMPERRAEMTERATDFLRRLSARYAHPLAGFQEAVPPKLPLRSNPHMHLFEAAQAWQEVEGAGSVWSDLAGEIADLCTAKFIDPATGTLGEFFDQNWAPHRAKESRVIEPGHQFEWAWLLTRHAMRNGDQETLAKARRLFDIGEAYGVDHARDVAIMALGDDFSVIDPVARLWPQTEWLKSAILFAAISDGAERERYIASATRACSAFDRFLHMPVAGLWWDKQRPDGSFVDEPAPASSFYHIVCAIGELNDRLADIGR